MKLIESRERYRCPIFRVTEDTLADRAGATLQRAVVRHAGSAVVLPVDPQGRAMLVRQYRWPAKQALWELCAGRIDPGETPLAAAKRELREETGLQARRWKRLASFWASPGFLDERMHLYRADGLTAGAAEPDGDEAIVTRWFSPPEIEALFSQGRIQDAKALIGLLLHLRKA